VGRGDLLQHGLTHHVARAAAQRRVGLEQQVVLGRELPQLVLGQLRVVLDLVGEDLVGDRERLAQ
jgi:hypothetical protein